MKQIHIARNHRIVKGSVKLPMSKSIANRVLLLAHLMKSHVNIDLEHQADDIILMHRLLEKINKSHATENGDHIILNCGNAGTVFRFLTAACALEPGKWLLTGNERMCERPVGLLVDALRLGGAEISYGNKENYPPLYINGGLWKGGDAGIISGNTSSQFLSALMMAGSFTQNGIKFSTTGKITSKPYLDMTVEIIRRAGSEEQRLDISESGSNYFISGFSNFQIDQLTNCLETDWSSASYFYSIAALSEETDLFLNDLQMRSLQGDSIVSEIYRNFGVISEENKSGISLHKEPGFIMPKHFEYNLKDYPDLAPTLAVTCAGLGIETCLSGLETLKIKESDRLKAIQNELSRLGIVSYTDNNSISIPAFGPGQIRNGVNIQTYNDHRIAMAFAPLALVCGDLIIEEPLVVEKSFPAFWDELEKILCLYLVLQ